MDITFVMVVWPRPDIMWPAVQTIAVKVFPGGLRLSEVSLCFAAAGGWALYSPDVSLQWWIGNFMLLCFFPPSPFFPVCLSTWTAIQVSLSALCIMQKVACLKRSKYKGVRICRCFSVLYSHQNRKHYLCSMRFATIQESQTKSILSCSWWEATLFTSEINLPHINLHAFLSEYIYMPTNGPAMPISIGFDHVQDTMFPWNSQRTWPFISLYAQFKHYLRF